jgi:bifunctional DNase/RNase
MAEALSVPDSITFEEAIALTQKLMAQIQQGQISDADLETTLSALVSSENGARGFFVTYLTDEGSVPDLPSDAVILALQSSPEIVAELLVKNLAMSAAMAITHRRNQNLEMAEGSDRVQRRTAYLIEQVQLPEVTEKAQKLHESATTGRGGYQAFLDRWGYDAEQRQTIQQKMEQIIAIG